MKTENNANRDPSPMTGVWPDPQHIMCKDCMYRDRTEVKIGDKTIKAGITRDSCRKFPAPPKGERKPHSVLFLNGDCRFYRKDEPNA